MILVPNIYIQQISLPIIYFMTCEIPSSDIVSSQSTQSFSLQGWFLLEKLHYLNGYLPIRILSNENSWH